MAHVRNAELCGTPYTEITLSQCAAVVQMTRTTFSGFARTAMRIKRGLTSPAVSVGHDRRLGAVPSPAAIVASLEVRVAKLTGKRCQSP